MYGNDGVLGLGDVNTTEFERTSDVRLPVRAVEEGHCAETLQRLRDSCLAWKVKQNTHFLKAIILGMKCRSNEARIPSGSKRLKGDGPN